MALHDTAVAPDLSAIPPLIEWVERCCGDDRLDIAADRCVAEIVDNGHPFDPSAAPPPDLAIPLHQRDPGGLGIHLMRQMTDRVEYRRTEGHNRLRIETV